MTPEEILRAIHFWFIDMTPPMSGAQRKWRVHQTRHGRTIGGVFFGDTPEEAVEALVTSWREDRSKQIKRLKYYRPYPDNPETRCKIVDREFFEKSVVLLCEYGDEYVVFTDLLIPGSIPCDKFPGLKLKTARAMFRHVCAGEKKRK